MTTVEMIVNMDCHGCERKVRKALQNLDGVENVDIDMELQKVTVTGWVDQEKVLRKVRKTGKKAEIWPFPYNAEAIGFTQQYHHQYDGNMLYTHHSDPTTYFHDDISIHSYDGRGYNMNGHDTYTYQEIMPYSYSSTTGIGERASLAFSDENVNACSIM